MELHHSKHHQAYVTNLNNALQAHVSAVTSGDIASQIALQATIKFNGGGHINHSLWWQGLAPAETPEAKPEAAPSLQAEIEKTWGTLDAFKKAFSATLLSIQGSGWGWLVREGAALRIITTKDQDPVVGGEIPVFGVDMWEHAYYLQVSTLRPSLSGAAMGMLLFVCQPARADQCLTTTVSQWQGRLCRQHLERHQLEHGRGALPRNTRGHLGDPRGVHLKFDGQLAYRLGWRWGVSALFLSSFRSTGLQGRTIHGSPIEMPPPDFIYSIPGHFP
jgi:superoxide dismutase